MTFSESHFPYRIHIDFVPHNRKHQKTLNTQFGIKSFNRRHNSFRSSSGLTQFYGSLFINGFVHELKGRKVGSVDITINQEVKPSTSIFLDDYFEIYSPRDYLDYGDATNLILDGFKSKISDQKGRNKANLKGRDDLYAFLSKKAKDLIGKILIAYKWVSIPYVGGEIFDQFVDNPDYWYSRTLTQARNMLRAYIDKPTFANDYINTLSEILRTGEDGYIELKTGMGGSGFSLAYSGNALLDKGLRIPISYKELKKFLSFDNLKELSTDALFTLLFHHSGSYMSPRGAYVQDANQWWEINKDQISDKTVKTYNTIINTFSLENLGEQLFNKEFTIEFLIDRGAGIDSYFIERFSSFGISEDKITFTPSHPYGLKNAISSLITYLYFFPDTFYAIKQGGSNFMFGDIFKIRSPEYVADSGYSGVIEGNFMWSGDGSANGLTRENYEILAAEFSADDRFTHRDIRYLLGFNNDDIVSLLLSKFQTMFSQQVDENIDIIDLRIKSLNSLVGDFPFILSKYLYNDHSKALITELISQGIIENEVGLSAVTRDREGRIIWLEQGDFVHIIDRQRQKPRRFEIFAGLLTDAISIGNFIFDSITEYPCVDDTQPGYYPGAFFHTYEIRRGGATNYLHVLVDADGHIVTAFGTPYNSPYK